MDAKLKECPFCGEPAVEHSWPDGGENGNVGCLTTGCPMEDVEIPIDDWNKRAVGPNVAGLINGERYVLYEDAVAYADKVREEKSLVISLKCRQIMRQTVRWVQSCNSDSGDAYRKASIENWIENFNFDPSKIDFPWAGTKPPMPTGEKE